MGGRSSSTNTTQNTTLGNTTTSNPYVTSTTNNKGTTSNFQKGTALDTIYNNVFLRNSLSCTIYIFIRNS